MFVASYGCSRKSQGRETKRITSSFPIPRALKKTPNTGGTLSVEAGDGQRQRCRGNEVCGSRVSGKVTTGIDMLVEISYI